MVSEVLTTSTMQFCIIKYHTRLLHHALKYGMISDSINWNLLSLTWHPFNLVLLICTPTTTNLLSHQDLQVSALILYDLCYIQIRSHEITFQHPSLLKTGPQHLRAGFTQPCTFGSGTEVLRAIGEEWPWFTWCRCDKVMARTLGQIGPQSQIDMVLHAAHLTRRLCQTSITLGCFFSPIPGDLASSLTDKSNMDLLGFPLSHQ